MSIKKTLCRDLVGQRATLRRAVVTRGGMRFEIGEEVLIESTHQGRFCIRADDGREASRVGRPTLVPVTSVFNPNRLL